MRRLVSRLTRDLVLFIAGLSGLLYETVFDKSERPTLIVAFLAMMGLPGILRKDESGHHKKAGEEESKVEGTDGKPTP